MLELQGIDFGLMLNDVKIMDVQCQNQQQDANDHEVLAILEAEGSGNKNAHLWSPETNEEDATFPWTADLKVAFSSPKDGLCGRKRKMWEQTPAGGLPTKQHVLEEKTASKLKEKTRRQETQSSRLGGWHVEDLAAELDATCLSGLTGDLTTNSYSMSDALLSLPPLTVFKQEAPSPSANNESLPTSGVREPDSNIPNNPNNSNSNASSGVTSQLHHLLQQHTNTLFPSAEAQTPHHQLDSNAVSENTVGSTTTLNQGEGFQSRSSSSCISSPSLSPTSGGQQENSIDCRFQYVLAAATSIATKVNEETLTYLNQGQSYEIKLKKLGELSAYRGKILKSIIRICFHERRLQYMEREQMAAWQVSRPGDRIVEVDVPLSYGLLDVIQDPQMINTVEFLWDPTKEVGVYIKVNCISTEFTPKKHGGEKGVPFRIQVETFLQGSSSVKRLHAAACQIKVFKLKGADRKHKQDKEKILKRPLSEQEKFQPSYECTVLNDIPSDAIVTNQPMTTTVTSSVSNTAVYTPSDMLAQGRPSSTSATANVSPGTAAAIKEETKPVVSNLAHVAQPAVNFVTPDQAPLPSIPDVPVYLQPLASEATAQQTAHWLQSHRFSAYLHTFASFSGADLLRLSRDDLIQICGLPDGIRLYNALHSKTIAPRLTMYLCVEQSSVYHALYLDSLSCAEMAGKLSQLLGVASDQIRDVYLQGPNGIHVLVTDEVVRNLKDEGMFTIEILQDASEQYRLLLKPSQR